MASREFETDKIKRLLSDHQETKLTESNEFVIEWNYIKIDVYSRPTRFFFLIIYGVRAVNKPNLSRSPDEKVNLGRFGRHILLFDASHRKGEKNKLLFGFF